MVVATEDGKVAAKQGWQSRKGYPERTTSALLLQLDSGPVIVYGALIPNSWAQFGVTVGSRVRRGQPLGQVGTYPYGDTMLHIEARAQGTKSAPPWFVKSGVPANLLNITPYLERAAQSPDEVVTSPPSPSPAPPPLFPAPDLPLSRERWIQLALRDLVAPDLVVDGDIGPATKAAIRDFQKREGLKPDGIVGPKTLAALVAQFGQAPFWTESDLQSAAQKLKNAWSGALKEVFG